MTYLNDDAEASAVARKLRDIAWIEHLSSVNIDLICSALDTEPHISAVARKLRGFNDNAIAWIEYLSPVNMGLICAVFDTEPHIMVLASKYEAARRRAFPK